MTLKCNHCFSKLKRSREIHDQKIGYYKISMFKNRKKNNAKRCQRHEEKSNIHITEDPRWKGKRIKLKQHLKEYV